MQNNSISSGDFTGKKRTTTVYSPIELNSKLLADKMTMALNVAKWNNNHKNSRNVTMKIRIHFHLIIEIKCYCVTVNEWFGWQKCSNVSHKLRYLVHSIRTKEEMAIIRVAIKVKCTNALWWQINCVSRRSFSHFSVVAAEICRFRTYACRSFT